jgi:hypothetical protein
LKHTLAANALIRIKDPDDYFFHLSSDQSISAGFTFLSPNSVRAWFQCCEDGSFGKVLSRIDLVKSALFRVVIVSAMSGGNHIIVKYDNGSDFRNPF